MITRSLQNALECPDGTILVSTHRHDFCSHEQEDGRVYAVDGGAEYKRTLFADKNFKDLSIYLDTPLDERIERALWGTYGKEKKREIKWIYIKNMAQAHIKNCLDDGYLSEWVEEVMKEVYNRNI